MNREIRLRNPDGSETVWTESTKGRLGCSGAFAFVLVIALPLQFPAPLMVLAYLIEVGLAVLWIATRTK